MVILLKIRGLKDSRQKINNEIIIEMSLQTWHEKDPDHVELFKNFNPFFNVLQIYETNYIINSHQLICENNKLDLKYF